MPFDFYAVVVGSGFGASVVAYRLADAGKKVCVLERGKKYPPGSFPRSPRDVARNFWDPASGLFGMFDLWSFRRFEALVSSGLGGGSLIYANVLIRKDPNWFVDEEPGGCRPWPISYDDLATHYKAVEEMLGAQRYPFDHLPYSQTPKTIAMREAAQKRGLDWYLPKLAVTFGNPHAAPVPGVQIVEEPPAMYGLPRDTCRRSAANATSGATTDPRTRSTSITCRNPRSAALIFAPSLRCAVSNAGRAATGSTTSTTLPTPRPPGRRRNGMSRNTSL